jgi:hypothetical protein
MIISFGLASVVVVLSSSFLQETANNAKLITVPKTIFDFITSSFRKPKILFLMGLARKIALCDWFENVKVVKVLF